MTFDVIIVGGGVAGCALAARLSEDPDRTVCLVEAGTDYGPDPQAWPATLRDARALSREDVWERHVPMHRIRARVLGGASCINGCWNTWGSVADHAEWTRIAGPSWSASRLEPFRLRAVEQMRLRPVPEHEMSPWSTAALAAARELGFTEVADMSAPSPDPGYGTPLLNTVDGLRWNVAFAYLKDARIRPNLTILGDTAVHRLTVRNGRIRDVQAVSAGRSTTLVADTYVLSAGAVGTPALLLRSGIGPTHHLEDVGIRTEIDLSGVGRNLSEQPGVFVPLKPTADLNGVLAKKEAAGTLYISRALVRAASRSCPEGGWDLHILPTAGLPLYGKLPAGEYEAGVAAYLMKPASRGRVRLRSPDPDVPIDIDPGFLSDPDGHDVAVLRDGLRLIDEFANSAVLASLAYRSEGPPPQDFGDEQLRAQLGTYWHPVGTCAVGIGDDCDAVVDAATRVRGVSNLRIVDASILPTVPAANTQLPVLAVAEMMAENLRK